MHSLTVAARGLGLQLHVVELRRADELDSAFVAMTRADADALIVMRIDARTATLARLLRSPLCRGLLPWYPCDRLP